MQAQARICPKCKDDHGEEVTCRESELGQEVVKLRAENKRLREAGDKMHKFVGRFLGDCDLTEAWDEAKKTNP